MIPEGMKRLITVIGLAGCTHMPSGNVALDDPFAALVGTWTQRQEDRVVGEQWVRPHPRLLLGTGTTKRGERTWREQLAIELREDGAVYVAHPDGQARTEFAAVAGPEPALSFANPAHDFPQGITYRRSGTGSEARLQVSAKSSERSIDLLLERQPESQRPRDIIKTVYLDRPPAEVYAAFTSTTFLRSWFAPELRVEAEPWGAYELLFAPDGPEGSQGSEGCTFVELRKDRLAFTWRFPPSLPSLRTAHTLVIIEIGVPQDALLQTQLRLQHSGFRSGPEWEAGRVYFETFWDGVLARLHRRFEQGPIDWTVDGPPDW